MRCATYYVGLNWLNKATKCHIGRKVNIVRPILHDVNIPSLLPLRYHIVTMLRVVSKGDAACPTIAVEGLPVKALIAHKPWQHGSPDWELWFEHRGRMAHGKCQLRLLIESKLRAWLLEHYGMPLATLSFEELRLIAIGKGTDARRLHAGHVAPHLLPHRASATVPHASAA